MAKQRRWVAKLGRWVAKMVACLLDIFQKYKMGDISKGVANTLLPAKKIFKKSPGRIRIRISGLRIRGFGRSDYGSRTKKRTRFQKDEVG